MLVAGMDLADLQVQLQSLHLLQDDVKAWQKWIDIISPKCNMYKRPLTLAKVWPAGMHTVGVGPLSNW